MKNIYPIQVIDLSYQVDHVSPREIQIFEEYRVDLNDARWFVILIRDREFMMISQRTKMSEVKVM